MDTTEEGLDGRPPKPYEEAADSRNTGLAGNVANYANGSTGDDASNYMFENPQELAAIISQWMTGADSIGHDRTKFLRGAHSAMAPAADVISTEYTDTVLSVLSQFIEHNDVMNNYTKDYTQKLAASHRAMGALDNAGQGLMQDIHRAFGGK
jgi:hypothetical protein